MRSLEGIRYVVMGASAGGLDALKILLPSLKRPSSISVLLVIHLPPQGPNLLPSLLKESCDFTVKEASPSEEALPETIYIAAPDYHLSLEPNGQMSLTNEDQINFSRPSIDALFESAAYSQGDKVMGILLTGSNNDGASGLSRIKKLGGIAVVQDPKTSEYPTMPQSALNLILPDYVGDLEGIKNVLTSLHSGDTRV